MTQKCKLNWSAPYLHPNGNVTYSTAVCDEPKGHEGDHMSWAKVTTPRRD